MKEMKGYMEGSGSTIGLRVAQSSDSSSHDWRYFVVDIHDLARVLPVAAGAAEGSRRATMSGRCRLT